MDGFVTRPAPFVTSPAVGVAATETPTAIPGDGWALVKKSVDTQSRKHDGRAAITANIGLFATTRG